MRRRRYRKQPIQKKESSDQFLKPTVQTKLNMGKPGDKYEVEADQMADKVTNNKKGDGAIQKKQGEEEVQQKPLASSVTPLVQKKGASEEENAQAKLQRKEEEEPVQAKEEEEVQAKEEEEVQKKGEEEEVQAKEEEEVQAKGEEEEVQAKEEEEAQAKEEEEVQKKSNGHQNRTNGIEKKLRNGSGGQKIDANTRAEMEQGFGADFSHVRVHNDAEAQNMSKDIGAQAFTHGNDIYFSEGKYDPNSKEGKHLLAHELTHTIQQKGVISKKEVPNVQKQDKKPTSTATTKPANKNLSKNGKPVATKKSLKAEVMKKLATLHPGIHKYISLAGMSGNYIQVRKEMGSGYQMIFRLKLVAGGLQGQQMASFTNVDVRIDDKTNPKSIIDESKISLNAGINTDQATPANIDKYAKNLYHEGIHMLLHMENIISFDTPKGHVKDPLKTSFDQYQKIASGNPSSQVFKSKLLAALNADTSIPTNFRKVIPKMPDEIFNHVIEEKFVFDQEKKHFGSQGSNLQIAASYILEKLQTVGSSVGLQHPKFKELSALMTSILNHIDVSIQSKSNPKPKPTP